MGSVARSVTQRTGALAAALLAAAGVSGCGGTGPGYIPLGAARPTQAAAPPAAGGVVLVPLAPGLTAIPTPGTTAAPTPAATTGALPVGDRVPGTPVSTARSRHPSPGTGTAPTGTPPTGAAPTTPAPSGPPPAPTPALLGASAPRTSDGSARWCQNVTLTLANSGGRTATAGTVSFATHVIGLLGTDWATYRTDQPLRAPVPGRASVTETWTVCLDSWRVPAGMHLETPTATVSTG